ncbi:MAG: hypothetical protein ACFFCX_02860 [Candidatus Sifarchaeia archaeon]
MVNRENQKEREIDKILLLMSQPLTRLILSVLAGLDPGRIPNNLFDQRNSSNN